MTMSFLLLILVEHFNNYEKRGFILNKLIKRVSSGLIILNLSMIASVAHAQQKIGYVNSAKIFQALPQREAVTKKLQREFKDKEADLKNLEAKIKTKMEKGRRDGQLLGKEGVRKLQIEVASLQAEYKIKAQSLEQEGNSRDLEEKQKLFKIIQSAVKKVAEKNGFDLVIDAQALQFAKPSLDLSEKVIKEIK